MQKYDLYWYNWIFEEDLISKNPQTKVRPVIVLDDDMFCPILKVTHVNKPNSYALIDWKSEGLVTPSYVVNKKYLANKKDLIGYIGHLSDKDIQNLKSIKLIENLDIKEYDYES